MSALTRKSSHLNDATFTRYSVYTDNACYGRMLLGEYGSLSVACYYKMEFEAKYGACTIIKKEK